WYSSDKQAEGGMNIGEWREQLRERIGSTDFVLAILSPQSRDRPQYRSLRANVYGPAIIVS
ncbi:MAG TPA: hypothetical protein VHQ68_03030, partial [Propionibacteriaceae bacterium]|nr:hypothetical protein [Propionibacteriaceae bacterium]